MPIFKLTVVKIRHIMINEPTPTKAIAKGLLKLEKGEMIRQVMPMFKGKKKRT